MYDIIELNKKLVGELREIADKLEIKKADKLKKEELIYQILDQQAINPKAVVDVKKEDTPQPKKPTLQLLQMDPSLNLKEKDFLPIKNQVCLKMNKLQKQTIPTLLNKKKPKNQLKKLLQ